MTDEILSMGTGAHLDQEMTKCGMIKGTEGCGYAHKNQKTQKSTRPLTG